MRQKTLETKFLQNYGALEEKSAPPPPHALFPLIWYALVPTEFVLTPLPWKPAGPPMQLCSVGAV